MKPDLILSEPLNASMDLRKIARNNCRQVVIGKVLKKFQLDRDREEKEGKGGGNVRV